MKRIVFPSSGQTCNKFFSLLSPLNYSFVNGEGLQVILPDKALDDYPNLVNNKYLKFPLWSSKIAHIIEPKRFEDFVRRIILYGFVKNPLIPSKVKNSLIWDTWSERDFVVSEDFLPVVVQTFMPAEHIRKAVDREFETKLSGNPTILGLHIRRGDYKEFEGGKYYYSDDDWLRIMETLTKQFKGEQIIFFIASNERIETKKFEGFNVFTLKSIESGTADLYALSKCDYIIGPPSSFSNWAAMVGQKPLCWIDSPKSETYDFVVPNRLF